MADELGTTIGEDVGYSVRFNDRVGDGTLVRVMTDGILLAELQRDRMLRRYDTLIIDEAHERSLNIDFILGYLRQLLPQRPDLKVIVTSATIDTERFARHFADADGTPAPIVTVTGRTFPVEVRYRPFGEEPDDDRDQVQAIVDAVEELGKDGRGDVLVFLSGEREIHDTADALRRGSRRDTEVLPLYARLSGAEQHRIFEPHTGRRIVLATNVAETSITVPGVRYVVDAGTARISRYSRRLKVQRLPIEPISRASADQRAGRCGRVAAGVCIRLFAEDDHLARPEFTEPEILRTNLASVILQMTAIGLGDVAAFPFVEPPDAASIRDGYLLLEELGAIVAADDDGPRRLTEIGRRLARLPVDPRLGRMVLEAERHGCVREVLVIAAALSIQDPGTTEAGRQPATGTEKRQAADELHRRFDVPGSDLLSIVALWDHLRERQRALSSNQFRRLCRNEFLNYLRVREWQDLFSQLRSVAADLGVRAGHGARPPGPRPPVGAGRAAVAPRAARPRHAPVPRRPGRDVHDRQRVGAGQEVAAVGDGGRAGGDEPAVGPAGGDGRAGVGRAHRRAPRAALVRRAALGRPARRGRGDGDGDAVRPADRRGPHGASTTASTGPGPGSCSSATPSSTATGWPTTRSSPATRRSSTASGGWRPGCAGASCSTTRRWSGSTTSGSAPTSRRPATSTGGGSRPRPGSRSCSTSPTPCSRARAGSTPPTTRTTGATATWCCRCRTATTPAGRSTACRCTCR